MHVQQVAASLQGQGGPQFGVFRRSTARTGRKAQARTGSVSPRALFTGILAGIGLLYGALAVSQAKAAKQAAPGAVTVRTVGALENGSVSVLALLGAARVASGFRSKEKSDNDAPIF